MIRLLLALLFVTPLLAYAKPNVLFIIVDDLNDWVGWMGGHPQARTPNMDKLARRGMRFANAHTAYALCNPSRTALLTGMAPAASGVFGNEQDWRRSIAIEGKATLPEHFKAHGYRTAAGGKIFHANHGGPESRLAGWHGGRRGFEQDAAWDQRFPERGVQLAMLPVPTGQNFNGLDIWHWDWGAIDVRDEDTEDGQTVAWAANFLREQRDATPPFFLAVGIYKPHSPWYAPRAYFDERKVSDITLPPVKDDDLSDVPKGGQHKGQHHAEVVKANAWQAAVHAYLSCITFADAQIGKLLAALDASPAAANTIVCLTSDHGWYLGEKRMWHKGKLWERATHVPLTIFAPGVTAPDTSTAQPASLLDVYPTLCDLAGLPLPSHLSGESLLPMLRDPKTKRTNPAVTTMKGDTQASYAARDERWRYIRYADGGEELYDHVNDPNEWTNVAANPEHAEVKESLGEYFPQDWVLAHRQLDADLDEYDLQPGDRLEFATSGRNVSIDTTLTYRAAVDSDSSLLSQGDESNGWALHLVAGCPTLSVFSHGARTSLQTKLLADGPAELHATITKDGKITLNAEKAKVPSPMKQPKGPLEVGESFGPLSAKAFPNSTPFDGELRVKLRRD